MQGRKWLVWSVLVLAVAGCREETDVAPTPPVAVENRASSFDAAATGAIEGRVVWKGPLPEVPSFEVHAYLDYLNAKRLRGEKPNPHTPRIDENDRGIGEVLIRLDRIDPAHSKPWPHAPASVEMLADGLFIRQGKEHQRIGIVQRGAEVAFVRRDAEFHIVRARGAAFFSLPFVAADRPTTRRLDRSGLVELSEGAGVYWRRAYLAVMDHPYAALTNRSGRFLLDGVPAGTYRLTAWLPNWHVERHEHEPETAIINRIYFAPAVEQEQTVTVTAGQSTAADFAFALTQFKKAR
jgi:Polysaccharide lyase family 4, domain II